VEAPLQVRYRYPRRADARRSCFRTRRVSPTACDIGVAGAFPEQHGGLTPAAPDPDAGHARPLRFPLPVRCSYQRPDLSLGLGSGQKRCGEKRQVNVSRFGVARWISDKSDASRSVKSMCLDLALHVGFGTKAMRGEVSSECVSISRCTLDFGQKRCGQKCQVNVSIWRRTLDFGQKRCEEGVKCFGSLWFPSRLSLRKPGV
jgi:hypothetical protein